MENATAKLCRRCDRALPLSAFSRRSASKDGLQHQCKECASGQFREWRAGNLGADRARVHSYGVANRESLRDKARKRYREDPEKYREASRRWYEQNRDKALERASEYGRRRRAKLSAEDRERITAYLAAWQADNPDKVKVYNRRRREKERTDPVLAAEKCERVRSRRARIKGSVVAPFTLAQLEARLSMFPGCWMCGGSKDHIEHVKPIAKGGAHMLGNLRWSCRSCNHTKSDRWPVATSVRAVMPRPRLP